MKPLNQTEPRDDSRKAERKPWISPSFVTEKAAAAQANPFHGAVNDGTVTCSS